MPLEVYVAIIGAASALVGVIVGGYWTAHNQRRERQQRRINDQLAEFYGPMLALHVEVLAKSEMRPKVSGVANVRTLTNGGLRRL